MFSMLPTPIHTRTQPHHHYTPVHPSPLSSSPLRSSPTPSPLSQRDANVPTPSPVRNSACFSNPQSANLIMSSPTPTPTPKSRTPTRLPSPAPTPRDDEKGDTRESAFSRRPAKANPLIHRDAQDGRETRRKLFLKRVRDGASERRYGGEEEMMRRIWVAEERRIEEERRREAMGMEVRVEEVEEDAVGEEQRVDADEMLVEEAARDEEEWEAFLGMMEEQSRQQQKQLQADTSYGSDDEEYDHIFMDVILEENKTASQDEEQGEDEHADMDMMDMS